ncbi:hypothetical protein FRC12_018386 [Ceratobasidium sp. 428]|nr:hypothetical protein FRC12_018386 [Ceratobasidium sp. 428]
MERDEDIEIGRDVVSNTPGSDVVSVGVIDAGKDDVKEAPVEVGNDSDEVEEGWKIEVVEIGKVVDGIKFGVETESKEVESVDKDKVIEVVETPEIVGDDMRVDSVERGGGVKVDVD